MKNNFIILSKILSKFGPTPCFLLLSLHVKQKISFGQSFLSFLATENSSYGYFLQSFKSWIRIRIKKAAGSRSALRKTAGSRSAKMNADPQP